MVDLLDLTQAQLRSVIGLPESPANNTVLKYNTTTKVWDPTALSALGLVLSDISDVTISVANLNSLDDGVNSTLHFHDSDRDRANHTGTQLASTISDFDTEVSNNPDVVANTAKVTNATHTGDVTGATALTIANDVVTFAKMQNIATPRILGRVTAATGDVEELTGVQVTTLLGVFTDLLQGVVPASGGGTTNFLRADGSWAVPAGSGVNSLDDLTDVTITTRAANQVLVVNSGNTLWVNSLLVDANISGSANISLSKLATDPLDRANHTGTQLHTTVSDFDAGVQANRLDQMAAPTASVAMNSQKITGLLNPTLDQDAATKKYVDDAILTSDTLAELTDVTITTRAGNQVLVVNSGNTAWINALLVDANISGSAAIAYSKLNLTGAILNADLAGSIATSKLADNAVIVLSNQANSYTAGMKQTFSQSATTAGISFGAVAGNPSGLSEGDMWYNATTNRINYRTDSDTQEIVTIAGSQTLTNKTFTTPTIASFVNAAHDHENAAGGGQLTATDALDATGTKDTTTFLRGDNTWAVPPGVGNHDLLSATHTDTTAGTVARGDLITGQLASAKWQRLAKGTANQIFQSDGTDIGWVSISGDATLAAGVITISDEAVTFAKMQHIATDRLLGRDTAATGDVEELTVGGGIEFTGSGGIQRSALTGDVTASAGSGSTTVANVPDGAFSSNVVLINQSNTYGDGQKQTFNPNATNAGINVGSHTAAPSSPADGDVYLNSTDNKLYGRINGAWVDISDSGSGISNIVEDTTPEFGGDVDALDNSILNVDNITSTSSSASNWDIGRDANIADGVLIGRLRFRAHDGGGVLNDYALFESIMVSDATGAEEGQLNLVVAEGGDHNVGYVKLNDNGNNKIDLLKPTVIADSLTLTKTGVNNQLLLDRPENMTDGEIIGNIIFRAYDNGGVLEKYADIHVKMEEDDATEEGSLLLRVMEGGVINTEYVRLNDNGNNQIDLLKTVSVTGNITVTGTVDGVDIATNVITKNTANTYDDGQKQTFNPDGTNAGLNVGSHTTAPSSPSDGDVYLNTTDNKLYARINAVWVDLGASGSGISNIVEDTTPQLGGDLDGNGFDINLDANTMITFDTGTQEQNIFGDLGGINYRVPTDDTHEFRVNDNPEFIISATEIDFQQNLLKNTSEIQVTSTGSSTLIDIERPESVTDGTNIAEIRMRGYDGGSTLQDYGKIVSRMESDVATAEQGAMLFYVAENGNHASLFMTFNNDSDGEIDLLKPANVTGNLDVSGTFTTGTYVGQASVVTVGTITTGVWNGTAIQGAYTDIDVNELTDVTITSIASGEILKWDGVKFINNTLAEAGISATGHTHLQADVTDFDVTGTELADGTIWIGNASNVAVEITMSGDITITNAGVTTIGALKVSTGMVQDDAVTYAKIQNVSATDRILGRDSAGAGDIEEITPTNLRTMINVADGANNYSHPNHTGDVTSTGDGATVIADEAVTLAKMAHVATARFLGRVTAATGDVEALTGTQATTLLDEFTSSLKGLVPSSGGGTVNFLRADGSWADPGAGSSPPFADNNSIVEGNADATKELRFEVDGNTTGIIGVIATIFTTAKTITIPDATDTLVGRQTTDILQNKTFDLTANTLVATSQEMRDAISDETGVGLAVFNDQPVFENSITIQETGAPATLLLKRPEIMADDVQVGVIQFEGDDAGDNIQAMGVIDLLMKDDTVGNYDTSFRIRPYQAGSPVTYITADGEAQLITLSKNTNITGTLTATTYTGQASIVTLGTITTGTWNGTVIDESYLDADVILKNTANTYDDGQKQTFNPNATNAGLNVGSHTGAPSSPADGDVYLNSTDNKMYARINGAWVDLGASGSGESNVTADVGGGAISIRGSTPKSGVTLNLRTFANGNGMNASVATDLITLAVASTVVQTDQTNTFGDFDQIFTDNTLKIQNPAGTFVYRFTAGAITGADKNMILPVLTASDTLVFENHSQSLANKTINAGLNTITGITNTMISASSAIAFSKLATLTSANILVGNASNVATAVAVTGDISITNAGVTAIAAGVIVDADIASNAEIAVSKLQDGNAGQFVRTNSAGTGVEWADDIVTVTFVIDGGGSVITTGKKPTFTIDFDCEVIEWAVISHGGISGAIVIDINRSTYAGWPTTSSIASTEKPTITATNDSGEDRSLTLWSDINAGDIIEPEVDSVTSIESCSVSLVLRKKG